MDERWSNVNEAAIMTRYFQLAEDRAAHLLGAHVEFGADLTRVPGQQRRRRQGARPVIVLLLVHGRHQTKVSNLHHIVHGEEDVGGLSDRSQTHRESRTFL